MNLADDMQRVFGLPPRFWADLFLLKLTGRLIINPMIFEKGIRIVHGKRVGENESLNEFVEREFGGEAVALIERAIKGERFRK